MVAISPPVGTYTFDLGTGGPNSGLYPLQNLLIWQWNETGYTNLGISSLTTAVSSTSGTSGFDTPITQSTGLTQAPGTATYNSPSSVDMSGHGACRWVQINVLADDGYATESGMSRIQFFYNAPTAGGVPTDYALNNYIGTTLRVSNTSGTIILVEWSNTSSLAQMGPDSLTAPAPWTYATATSTFNANVAARHPAINPGPSGSSNSGLLNVAFVDGHVDTLSTTTINPSSPVGATTAGDVYWNNFGANRQD